MKNIMEIDGRKAVISFDPDIGMFCALGSGVRSCIIIFSGVSCLMARPLRVEYPGAVYL